MTRKSISTERQGVRRMIFFGRYRTANRINSVAIHLLMLCCPFAVALHAATEPRVLTPSPSSFESLSRFTELLDALQKNYVEPSRIHESQHTTVALRAFVRSIDPEADLLTAEEIALTNESANGSADVGIRFALRGDYPTIVSAQDNSPAQDAGLLEGEQLLAIDKRSLFRARRFDVQRLMHGPANSRVTLRVVDPATGAAREFHLLRAKPAASPSVPLKFLDNGVAYCRLPEFTQPAVEDLRAAMARAKKERAAGVILDLRDNAGGTFEAAQVAASMFLPKAANIVALEYGEAGQRATFVSNAGEKFTMPLVVLVNAGTAGEAELFAAALQDNKRARIVGSRTFGRAYLTGFVALDDGSVLSLPTAYYQRPSKGTLQGRGVTPDVIVDLPRQTERLIERMGFSTFRWPAHRTEVLATDLPLAKAMSLLAR